LQYAPTIYIIPAIPVCPRLPDGQGQAGMLGLSNGVNKKFLGYVRSGEAKGVYCMNFNVVL